jgi:arylsulfatase A-like enzyme
LVDAIVSRTCQAYFLNRSRRKPFMLVASLTQPHDICALTLRNLRLVPEQVPFAGIADRLPTLAPNHGLKLPAPKKVKDMELDLSQTQWRYYNYIYYRMVEMMDADVGRILDALEDSGEADNTLILFSSDHGESRGRHGLCAKWHPYDEAAKVPFIVSWPGQIAEGRRDETHLVSGLDPMPTFCDFAGIKPPPLPHARSLRPLLEEKPVEWRDYLVFETRVTGRTVRTAQYKYVDYSDDPIKQLFDMKADPWEMRNLYDEARCAAVIEEHRRLLKEWESRLEPSKRPMPADA